MSRQSLRVALFFFLLFGFLPGVQAGAAASPSTRAPDVWTAWGGTIGFRWNDDLLSDLGMRVVREDGAAGRDARGFVAVPLREQGGLQFAVVGRNFDHFAGGSLGLRGGFRLALPDGELSLVDAVLRPRSGDAQTLDLVGADGTTWFYLDKLMYAIDRGGRALDVRSMDLRVHPILARRLGKPQVADWGIAGMRMTLDVLARDGGYIRVAEGAPVWPGTAVPGVPGATYQADVFMTTFSAQYMRCTNAMGCTAGCACDGPGGATDGHAVFAPSSTLRNNMNDGVAVETVPGDPLGTSTALYTADVSWRTFFSGTFAPYDNDQHPNLIWNLYRIDADGRIDQIGRSGVKHAYLTTNGGCAAGPGSGGSSNQILGRSCRDTYGLGDNDDPFRLGPRSEIVPVQDLWGRCGSIFDPNCDGSQDANGNTSYSQRMVVRESQLGVAGASYLFESWYIVRDDIDVYNTMATRPVRFTYASGGPWSISNDPPYRLGPAIDRWVDPASANANEKSVALANAEGHTKVAVKATDLGNGEWRYDYAVMNVDFARAATRGTPSYADDADPAQRYRVIHGFGYDRFSVPLPTAVAATSIGFSDGDLDAANDWTAAVGAGAVTWTAPANPAPPANVPPVLNPLNWGTLFRFSLVAARGPAAVDVDLHVAEAGTPASYAAGVIGPAASDTIFADGFDAPTP